jgi:pectate lyase
MKNLSRIIAYRGVTWGCLTFLPLLGACGGPNSKGGESAMGGVAATGGSDATAQSTGGADVLGGTSGLDSTSSGGSGTAAGGTTSSSITSSGGASAATGGAAASGGHLGTGGFVGSSAGIASTGAPETVPSGYGQATTGGGSVAAVQANTMAAAQALIDAYSGTGGLVITFTGTFDFASIADPCTQHTLPAQTLEIKRKSNITIMGADGSAANFGIHIASSSSNIIIRNMTFGLLPGGGNSDAISIEGMSGGVPTNIWIDHNELFSSMVECAGAGDTSFDGLIDAKKGADNITVSYNYIHDHHKASLNGYTDDDSAIRHITFHHNVFENIGSRTPLQRHGYSHVLNNYFNQITVSGINIRMSGYSLVESNYFENSKNPVTSRDSTELGCWELRNNNVTGPSDFSKYNITWSASSSTPTKDATDWATTAAYPVDLGYSYTADNPQCLKDGLHVAAGAGKGLATLKCN